MYKSTWFNVRSGSVKNNRVCLVGFADLQVEIKKEFDPILRGPNKCFSIAPLILFFFRSPGKKQSSNFLIFPPLIYCPHKDFKELGRQQSNHFLMKKIDEKFFGSISRAVKFFLTQAIVNFYEEKNPKKNLVKIFFCKILFWYWIKGLYFPFILAYDQVLPLKNTKHKKGQITSLQVEPVRYVPKNSAVLYKACEIILNIKTGSV